MKKLIDKLSYGYDKDLIFREDVSYENKLKLFTIAVWIIFTAMQFVMVFLFKGEQVSDSKFYLSRALEIAEANSFYPNMKDIYNTYLFGNGYINFLALIFRFTSNLKVVYILNILFTNVILVSCLSILKKTIDNKKVLYCFIIIFCFLNTFISETVALRTETLFTALCYVGIALLFTKKAYNYWLCGVIFALANWIRPLGIAFLIGGVFIHICYKRKIKHVISTVISYLVTIILIGTVTYVSCGHFVFQSTTFGVNLIMSANDKADGSYMNVFGEGDAGYIEPEIREQMTFKDFDKYYTRQSLKWIIENPHKYIIQFPKKLFYLFATETYSGESYFNNEIETGGITYIKNVIDKVTGNSKEKLQIGDCLICINQLWYMIVVVLCLFGIYILFKKGCWRRLLPLLIILFIGTCITILVVGGARYHFIYLPIFMIYASVTLGLILDKKKKVTSDECL